MSQSKFIKTMAVLLIALAVLTVVNLLLKRGSNSPSTGEEAPIPVNGPTVILPEGFSPNLIAEKNAEIIKAFDNVLENGQRQLTVKYVSKFPVLSSLDIYTQYLSDNGWAVHQNTGGYDEEVHTRMFIFSKDKGQKMLVLTSSLDDSNRTIVDITLIISPSI